MMRPTPDKPIVLSGPRTLEDQIRVLPKKVFIGANRYDTDTEVKLHLWDAEGKSYDLVIPKVQSLG
jgi:hypothetical protein